MLSQIQAEDARLGADCRSKLHGFTTMHAALQPVFALSDSLLERVPVQLDEAMLYLRDSKLCELLLSLLRR